MELYIDHRECKLKPILEKAGISCVYENLDVGDIQFRHEGAIAFVFERKTLADLAASIQDGRYKMQKAKMLEQCAPSQIYYILEGTLAWGHAGGSASPALQGAYINTLLRDKLAFFNTRTPEETCHLILAMWQRFAADPAKYLSGAAPTMAQPSSSITRRKDPLNPTSCFIHQLCQVPGISEKSAEAITGKWPTLIAMMEAVRSKTQDEKLNLLKEICTIDNKGRSRKLSSKIAQNLVQCMLLPINHDTQ